MEDELWMQDKCLEYIETLRVATTTDLERYLQEVEKSKHSNYAVTLNDTPIDAALTAMRERCTNVEARYRSVLEKMGEVEEGLNEATIESFKLKQKMKFHVESQQVKEAPAQQRPRDSDLASEALASIPANASAEEQVEILKNALAALSVENQVLRGNAVSDEASGGMSPGTQRPASSPRYRSPSVDSLSSSSALAPAAASAGVDPSSVPEELSSAYSQKNITLEGYLMKRGGKTDRKWQRRYCILELRPHANMYVINYRVKEKDNTEKGHIPLPWATVSEVMDARVENCFMICPSITQNKTKNFFLAAHTPQEMREWIFAIDMASRVTPTAESILKLGYVKLEAKRQPLTKRSGGSRIGSSRMAKNE
eukprot:TRINITY_DN18165_c0_g1_i1.p1 TRINITY_DN18165_c0_g1~~TRINITY_DN18165_c0_g1_i1.p1  ORF type:complete len:368 (+),score=107.14 TRINITY_DN18165_c0_g1_i1:329-1432(+)